MELRQSLFWDTDVNALDLKKHQKAIIERILMRGLLEEFQSIMQYYGKDTIKSTALKARYLDKRTLAFCSTIFETPKAKFRCYKLEQLNLSHRD